MIVFPHAKINIGLHVTRKRSDGYHELETIFYPVGWSDILEMIPSPGNSAIVQTGLKLDSLPEENLCFKAFRMMQKDYDLPQASFFLHKLIPSGAGLGGGSSDAAYTLRIINAFFKLNLDRRKLENYATMLGSDCAFFVQGEPSFASGRGEILTPISFSLKEYFIVLVVPPVHVSTKEAYAGIRPKTPGIGLTDLRSIPLILWKDLVVNDFEESIFQSYPIIENVKLRLYEAGALYASMSGSGSSVYGIFKERKILSKFISDCIIYWDDPGKHP